VVGVSEHQRGAQFVQLGRGEGLDGRLRANRCEDRRDEVTVRGGEDAYPGTAIEGGDAVFENGGDYTRPGGG
jgi:hypothetical protein